MASQHPQKKLATVFYSWQSDLPNATNRGFIEDALKRALAAIHKEDSLSIEPVIDRDTKGVAGSPDISQTIFNKIDIASAFVADVSIINSDGARPTPNPNVLIETGYAIKSLGWDRIILVHNVETGRIEDLPFDLRSKRILSFTLSDGEQKAEIRNQLQRSLEQALKVILDQAPVSTEDEVIAKAISNIEAGSPSQGAFCARVVPTIAKKIKELNARVVSEDDEQRANQLESAIEETLSVALDFARVAESVATHQSVDGARGLFRGFADLFLQYRNPRGYSGHYNSSWFDLPKFVGHELITMLFSSLIAEHRWDLVADLCRQRVFVENAEWVSLVDTQVSFRYASEKVQLLQLQSNKPDINRVSVHADILQRRHENGELSVFSPYRQFQEADVFLFLRSFSSSSNSLDWWRPTSAIFLDQCPSFWIAAVSHQKAIDLADALELPNITELKGILERAYEAMHRFFSSERHFYHGFGRPSSETIGTKFP